MKNLKEIIVLFVTSLSFLLASGVVSAEEASEETSSVVDQVFSGANETVDQGSRQTLESLVRSAYGAQEGQLQSKVTQSVSYLKQVESAASGIGTPAGDARFVQAANQASGVCDSLSQRAATCCANPDSCSVGFGNFMKNASPWVGALGGLMAAFSDGGGAAGCLAALPAITSGLAQSNGVGKACNALNNGGVVTDGGKSVQVHGATKTCDMLAQLIGQVQLSDPAAESQRAQILSNVQKRKSEIAASLSKDEDAANAQSASSQQALSGATQCAQALLGGEDITDDPTLAKAVDCGNASDAAANPSICAGYGNGNTGFDALGKAGSGLDLGLNGDPFEDEPDEDPFGTNEKGSTEDTPFNAGAGNNNTAANFAAGAGAAGANQKAKGKRRRGAKGKDLISGYKTSKGSGSRSGSGRKPAFKKFKSKFAGLKTNGKENKEALAALSKLVKAGISPDQSGSIFERVSNRFTASTAKEKLFDAKRNKKLWMEK